MIYMAKIAKRSDSDPVRNFAFEPGSITLRHFSGERKRGRPRTMWAPEVYHARKEANLF